MTTEEITRHVDPFSILVDAQLSVEKLRVQCQVRQTHLSLQGRKDPHTDELVDKVRELEEWIDGKVGKLVVDHPAYEWFSKVKGIGKENIGKIIGLIDIEKADTASSLWSFAGYAPKDGHAMKKVPGEKLPYNAQLRTMCWRVGGSLMKAGGKYYDYYAQQKQRLIARFEVEGRKVVPAAQLPKENGRKVENASFISDGHIHNMAFRLMIKLFLSHLWVVWRQNAGLPVRPCYAMEKLGHTGIINPFDMTDR